MQLTRRALISTSLGVAATGYAWPAPAADSWPGLTRIGWATDLTSALRRAGEARRPVLWLSLLGRLDQEFC